MSEKMDERKLRKIIIALIMHFIDNEGTDYLGNKGEPPPVLALTHEELQELKRLRDEARTATGWIGY